MDQCPPRVCHVNHGMNIIYFSVFNNATARCGEFDPFVAIWSFQYVSPYSLIGGPTCEAMKDTFGFVLTKRDKSLQCHVLPLLYLVAGGV
jgi:hypothetical protein